MRSSSPGMIRFVKSRQHSSRQAENSYVASRRYDNDEKPASSASMDAQIITVNIEKRSNVVCVATSALLSSSQQESGRCLLSLTEWEK